MAELNSYEKSQEILRLREAIAKQEQQNQTYDPNTGLITTKPNWSINLPRPKQTFINPEMEGRYPTPVIHDQGPWNAPVTVEPPKQLPYWNDARRIGRYYYALQSLPPGTPTPAWLDKEGIETAYKYLQETRPNEHWTNWGEVKDDDPLNLITLSMPVPPPNMIPVWEQQQLANQYEYQKRYKAWKTGQPIEQEGYTPDPSVRETNAIGIAQDTWDQLPKWKKAANRFMPIISTGLPGLGGAIIGGTIGGPIGALAGSGLMIGGAKYAEKYPDSPISKLFIALNWPAEQVEKIGGLEAQIIYSLVDPDKYGELSELFGSWENFVAAYKAGAVFYESLAAGQQIVDDRNVREELKTFDGTLNEYMSTWIDSPGIKEPNRVIVGHDITSNQDIITEVPDGKLANAWVMQEARNRILQGESAKEVYFSLAQNFGFMGSMKELVGNVLLDPLDLIGPIGNVTMGKIGKATGNTAMVEAFGMKGENMITNTNMYKTLVRQMPPEQAAQLSSFDRWLGNLTKEGLPKEYSNAPSKNPFNYLFGLTPKARANYLLSTFVDGLNNLIAHETDIAKIEQMINKVAGMTPQDAVKGADMPTMTINVGGQDVSVNVPKWYLSAEAQMLPTAMKDGLPAVQELIDAYKVAEPQRQIIKKIAEYMGMEPEALIKKLHNAKAAEANHMYTQFVMKLDQAAKAGDASAAKILSTLTKADEFKALSGGKLKQMADEFTRKNGIPFNESILKYKLLDTLENQIGKWAVDWFGVKPDRLLFRMGNVVKRAQSALLLGINPAYFFNNTIDNLVKMSWDGLIGLGKFANNKVVLDNLGFYPTRFAQAAGAMDVGGIQSGSLKMFGIDESKQIGESIRAAGRTTDTIQKVDDLLRKGDKVQVAQLASQLMEKWSSQTAMVRGIQEYLNRAWQPGKGFDKVSDDLRLILDAKEPGLANKVEKMIARGRSKKDIENVIFGKMGRTKSIRDVLDPNSADMLDHLGLIDEIDKGLKNAVSDDDIFNVFVNAIEKGQNKVAENIIRKMKKITQDATIKTSIEGFMGVIDLMDNLEQMNADFWLKHMEAMAQVFDAASKRSDQFRAATWQTGRSEASRNWNTQNNIYGAKTLGIFEGLGMDTASPEYLNVGKLIIGKNNVWGDFFKLTDELYTKFQDDVTDITDAERMIKWNDLNLELNQAYLDAIIKEDGIINQLNDAFIVQYAKQFENKGQLAILEARNWRSSIQKERRKMMQAQLLWRNGTIPEEALKWGDLLPKEIQDAITKLNQGKPIHTFNRATRDKISPKFWNDIYKQFVRDMSQASTSNAPGMVKSADLPKDLQADLPEIPKPEPDTKPKRPAAVEKHEQEVWKVISEKKPELGGVDENGLLIPDAKLNIIKYALKWSPEARAKARANADSKLHFTDITPGDIESAIALEADWIKRQMELPLDDPKRVIDEQGNVIKKQEEPKQVEDPFKEVRQQTRRTEAEQQEAIRQANENITPEDQSIEPVIPEAERIAQHIEQQKAIRQAEIDNQLAELQAQIDENNRLYEGASDTEIRAELRKEAARLEKQRQDLIARQGDDLQVEQTQTTQSKNPVMPESRKIADIQDEFIRSAVETSLKQMLDDVGLNVEIMPDNTRVVEAGGLGWYKDWYYGQKRTGSKEAKTWNASINRKTRSAIEHILKGTESKSEDILAYQYQILDEAFAWSAQNDIYTAWKMGDFENAIRLYNQIADTMDDATLLDMLHGDEAMQTQLIDAWIKSLDDNQVLDVADNWTTPTEIEPAPRMTPEQQAMIDARRQYADVLDTYDMLRSNAEEMQRRLPPVKVGKETAERVLFDYLNDRGEPGQYEAVRTIWEGLANNYAKNNPGKTPEDWYETWVFNYGGDEIDISGLNQLTQYVQASLFTENILKGIEPQKISGSNYYKVDIEATKIRTSNARNELTVALKNKGYTDGDIESIYYSLDRLNSYGAKIDGKYVFHSPEPGSAWSELMMYANEYIQAKHSLEINDYMRKKGLTEYGNKEIIEYLQRNDETKFLYQGGVAELQRIIIPDEIHNFARMLLRSDDKQILFELQWADSIDQKKQLLTALHMQDPVRAKAIFDQAMKDKSKYLWQGKRGLTHWTDDGLAIMHIFESGDVTSIIHETVHVYTPQMSMQHSEVVRSYINGLSKKDLPQKLIDQFNIQDNWKSNLQEGWHTEPLQHRLESEILATAYERYWADGKAPTPKLVQVFENFKRWMVEIYKSITGSDIDIKLNDDVKKVFEEWVTGEKVVENQAITLPKTSDEWKLLQPEMQQKLIDDALDRMELIDNDSRDKTLMKYIDRYESFPEGTLVVTSKGEVGYIKKGVTQLSQKSQPFIENMWKPIDSKKRALPVSPFRAEPLDPELSFRLAYMKEVKGKDLTVRQPEPIPTENVWNMASKQDNLLGDQMPDWQLQSQKAEVQQFKPKDESLQDTLFDTREQLPTIEGKDVSGQPGAEGTPLFGEQEQPRVNPIDVYENSDGTYDVVINIEGATRNEVLVTFDSKQKAYDYKESLLIKRPIENGNNVYYRGISAIIQRDKGGFRTLHYPDWKANGYDTRWRMGRGAKEKAIQDFVDIVEANYDKYKGLPDLQNNKPTALFQDAVTPKENAAQGAPFGTADQIIEAPTDEMMYEGWMNEVEPTLRKAMNDLMNSKVPEKGSVADGLSPEGKKKLRQYVGKAVSDLSSANMGAVKYAEARRKFSLLDYSARTGFDSVAGTFFPYQFWYTRSAMNWLLRIMADPKILADYLRLTQFAQDAEDREGFPTRLKGKVGIPAPFLPDWMGDTIYIDPMRKIFSFAEMARPFTQLIEENNLVNQKTAGAIQQMLEDEQITEEQAKEAIETRKGEVWNNAEIQARAESELEIRNPFDFAFSMVGPSLPISIGYNFTKLGDKDRISQLPITRTIQAVTSMMGIGGPRGVNIEEPLRRGFGLPVVDRFEDYRINRELSNMVADGLIDSQTAILAMIDRKGDAFEQAQGRVATQMNTKLFLSSVGLDFFPEGEEEMRAIQSEYYKAMEARYEQGDEQAFVKFWDEFPEYEARQAALNSDPEEMLRHFLRSNIWQAWNEKNGYEKNQIASAFGDVFENSFLNKDTRNYDDISTETYAAWAKTLGQTMPENLAGTPEIANANLPDEVSAQLNSYLQERDSNFPGIGETLEQLYALPETQQQAFRNQHPEIADYQSWRNRFITNNPAVVSYLTGESSELNGLPEPIQLAVYNYRVEVEDNFPNIYDTQSAYFAINNTNAKKNFIKQHPELAAYWDYRREYAAAYPQAAPYILSDESLSKAILGEDRSVSQVQPVNTAQFDDAILRLLAGYYYGGRDLTPGARAELTRLWEKAGKPAGSMDNWLNAYVWPTLKK